MCKGYKEKREQRTLFLGEQRERVTKRKGHKRKEYKECGCRGYNEDINEVA